MSAQVIGVHPPLEAPELEGASPVSVEPSSAPDDGAEPVVVGSLVVLSVAMSESTVGSDVGSTGAPVEAAHRREGERGPRLDCRNPLGDHRAISLAIGDKSLYFDI
jgi:hypothetical protein